jgi:hypothetical protein
MVGGAVNEIDGAGKFAFREVVVMIIFKISTVGEVNCNKSRCGVGC